MEKNRTLLAIVLSIVGGFFLTFVAIVGLIIWGFRSSDEGSQKKFFEKRTRIGVLEVNGVIYDSKKQVEQIEKMEEDKSIKGVIVRVNSPGGAVAPSQEIYDALKRLDAVKPVYTSMSSMAASGGYYIACGTRKIYADPGTITGSIGVIMQFVDLSKLYEWAKSNPYNIKTGKFKDIGSSEREMTAEEKALLQTMIDNVLSQFRKAVSEGRKLPYEKVIEISDGRIFSGEQAKNFKLVDELGGLREAADAMVREVKGEGKPLLVYPHKKSRMMISRLFEEDDEMGENGESSIQGRTVLITKLIGVLLGANLKDLGVLPEPTHHSGGLMYLMPLGR